MQISRISMMNPYRANTVAMKGFKEDNAALRKFDEFMVKNDLFLRAAVYPQPADRFGNKYFVRLYTEQRHTNNKISEMVTVPMGTTDYRNGDFEQVFGAGKTLKEAKLNLI